MKVSFFTLCRYYKTVLKLIACCTLFFIGTNAEVSHAEESEILGDSLVQNQELWETEVTDDGRVRIIGYSGSIDLNNLVIPSSINGLSVEVNLKEVFGEVLQTQTTSLIIEQSNEGMQPVRLTGEFSRLFSKQFESSKISSVDFGDADTSSITDMASMFYHCYSLNSLSLGSNFDTGNVKNMRSMFSGIPIKKINLGEKFNTSNVENMDNMFSDCFSLESLDLGRQFDTKNVQSMEWMFFRCLKLKSLNLGDSFDTRNVNSMRQMFSTCNSLTKLNLGELFDTTKVSDISGMFLNCVELESLDLGKKFDTSSVKSMMDVFNSCEKLVYLHLGDKFDTSNVQTMQGMFARCKHLTDFAFLESFDTSQVKLMDSMFEECLGLKKLKLDFDTQNVIGMSNMFSGCSNLEELELSQKFDSKNMTLSTSSYALLKDCKNLTRLIIPGSFKLGEGVSLKEIPSQDNDYYWAYKEGSPMSTNQLLSFHNSQPAKSLNTYELKKVYQVRFNTVNIPGTTQFPEKIFWENQIFKEIPKEYVKEGYTIKWSIDGEVFNDPIAITKSIIVNGEAIPIQYKITFDSNGGEEIKAITYTIQDSVDQLPTPIMKGHIFEGWYEGDSKISNISRGTTGDKELSAEWRLDTTSLEELINDEATLNRSASTYTSNSWESYTKAMDEAKKAINDGKLTLEKFNAIEKELVQAIKQLKEVEEEQISVLSFEGLSDRTVEKGAPFDPKAGVKATDSIDGDLTNKIKIAGTVDTSKVGIYSLNYSIENSAKKKLEQVITVQVVESGTTDVEYHTLEIPELILPKNADYRQAIMDKMVIKNSKGEVVPSETVDFSITSKGNTNKLGEMSALVTIPYANGTSLNAIVKIMVISGIEIVQPDSAQLFIVGDSENSFDPYAAFQAFEIGIDGKKTILGKYDAIKKTGIKIIDNPVDFSKPGKYTIRYLIINSLGETVKHSYTVTVNASNELKIEATDKVMYVGEQLTDEMILSWAKTENADKIQFEELDQAIPIDAATNKLTTAGEFSIRYIAYQDTGKNAEVTIKLIVKEPSSSEFSVNSTSRKNLPSTNKKLVNPTAKKSTLPKTGSEEVSNLIYVIGSLMVGSVMLFVVFAKKES